MRGLAHKPGFAAACMGAVILAHLAVLPLALGADRDFVYFRGEALPEACSLRRVFGVPCPTCGMTRGVVLALHGRVGDSAATNASAPVLVGVALMLGSSLAGAGGLRLAGRGRAADGLTRWIRIAGLAGAGMWAVVLMLNWVAELRAL